MGKNIVISINYVILSNFLIKIRYHIALQFWSFHFTAGRPLEINIGLQKNPLSEGGELVRDKVVIVVSVLGVGVL